jgi:hypothetical protein
VELRPTQVIAHDAEGGEIVILQEARLKSADDISPDARASISEITTGPNGGFKVKMHGKREALKDLGAHLGLFEQKVKVDVSVTHDLSAVAKEALDRVRALKAVEAAHEVVNP